MAEYDLHVHTNASPCSSATPESMVEAAVEAELDGMVVTDHDTTEGVARVRAAAPDGLTVVSGVEITTSQGHLLGIGIESAPEVGIDPLSAIQHVQEQGGAAVLAHPFDSLREQYSENLEALATAVDAVEGRNSRCIFESFNIQAARYANEYGLPITGGSDAHFPMEVGRARTEITGDVVSALRSGQASPRGRGRYVSGHVATKLHKWRTRWQSRPSLMR